MRANFMENGVLLNDERYIPAAAAAKLSGFTRDYITKLIRANRLTGQRIGTGWYVSETSIQNYILKQSAAAAQRHDTLASRRREEYRSSSSGNRSPVPRFPLKPRISVNSDVVPQVLKTPVRKVELSAVRNADKFAHSAAVMAMQNGAADAVMRTVHVPVYTLTPLFETLHRLTAFVTAVAITLCLYSIVDHRFATFALGSAAEFTQSLAHTVTHPNFAHIAHIEQRVNTALVSNAEGNTRTNLAEDANQALESSYEYIVDASDALSQIVSNSDRAVLQVRIEAYSEESL